MLIDFRVGNYRSIRDEQVLTMEASRLGNKDDLRPRRMQGHSTALLPAAAVYGANASGKSNLLAALNFMRYSVVQSHRSWDPDGGVPRDAFAWGGMKSQPSLFEITFLVNGVRYRYGFVVTDESVIEEWLYAWPSGRKQTWFEREGAKFKFGDKLGGENRLIEQVTRPNALFLSAAAQHDHEQLRPLFWWFSRFLWGNYASRHGWMPGAMSMRWLSLIKDTKSFGGQLSLFDDESVINKQYESFLMLLRAADVGIVDFKVEKGEEGDLDARRRGGRVLVRHSSSSDEAWLPLDEESQGTLTLFRIGPLMLDVLAWGGLLVVDELEASLHPLLALQIVRQFNDPRSNPRCAQILFTTHDTHLLGTVTGDSILRRDQIWLTEKDKEGATCLYPLSDYKPRKAENLERGYLQGRYGAIPFLGELAKIEK